jgi:uncharacterized membrane protein YccC
MNEVEGYTKIAEVRIRKLIANILAGVLTGLLVLFFVLIMSWLPHAAKPVEFSFSWFLVFVFFITMIHEGLHAYAAFRYGGLPRTSIHFGFNWKGMMPYCHLKAPISVKMYRIVGFMPLGITGPIMVAIFFFYPALLTALLAATALASCSGDVMMMMRLHKFADDMLVLDHPSEPGFDIYSSSVSK